MWAGVLGKRWGAPTDASALLKKTGACASQFMPKVSQLLQHPRGPAVQLASMRWAAARHAAAAPAVHAGRPPPFLPAHKTRALTRDLHSASASSPLRSLRAPFARQTRLQQPHAALHLPTAVMLAASLAAPAPRHLAIRRRCGALAAAAGAGATPAAAGPAAAAPLAPTAVRPVGAAEAPTTAWRPPQETKYAAGLTAAFARWTAENVERPSFAAARTPAVAITAAAAATAPPAPAAVSAMNNAVSAAQLPGRAPQQPQQAAGAAAAQLAT